MSKTAIDPKFVERGKPIEAQWGNDLVCNVRSRTMPSRNGQYIREPHPNPFSAITIDYKASGVDPAEYPYLETDDAWEFTLQPGYLHEIDETVTALHEIETAEGVVMGEYPTILAKTGWSLCVEWESDQYNHGQVITGGGASVLLLYRSGIEIEELNQSIQEEAIEYIPSADDGEVIDTDPVGKNGYHIVPVIGVSGVTGASGDLEGIELIQFANSNIVWQPDRRWNARDAYNTGDGLQWLQVEDNDPENHQPDSEPFIFRTITGQESGYLMVRNPEKCAVVLEYAGQTVEGEDDTATLVTGYNVLDDIDGSLTIKSGESELGKIEWSDGMMDTDDHVVVDIGGFAPNGPTGTISLVENGTTGTLIAADNGLVSSISSRTLYAREYQVCESGSPVTKTFLTLD